MGGGWPEEFLLGLLELISTEDSSLLASVSAVILVVVGKWTVAEDDDVEVEEEAVGDGPKKTPGFNLIASS